MKTYVVKDDEQGLNFAPAFFLEKASIMKIVDNPVRIDILKAMHEKPMFPSEIAKKLKLHEQIAYYHIKQLMNAGLISVVEKKEVRGTVAKSYSAKEVNFVFSIGNKWQGMEALLPSTKDKGIQQFFAPFTGRGVFDGKIIVGSPDQHGPFKARARDSHYSIDLSLFLGGLAALPKKTVAWLDVDINFPTENCNMVLLGGPAANLVVSSLNSVLPATFSDHRPWEIYSTRTGKKYSEDSVGVVIKMPNPHFPDKQLIILAGNSSSGTKSAVIALTQQAHSLLARYSGQGVFSSIVQGFDVDGDGHIDNIEILE